jgi:hypothetical protein
MIDSQSRGNFGEIGRVGFVGFGLHILENMDDSTLGKWEKSFFYSVRDQWERNRKLSDKQKEKLGEIWDAQD